MTTPNAELAYKTLDLINANPDHFDMEYWVEGPNLPPAVGLDDLTGEVCGTTACFAGWAAALAGYKITGSGSVYNAAGHQVDNIQLFAANLLGIETEEADDLFYVANDEIAAAVEEYFGPRPGGDQ